MAIQFPMQSSVAILIFTTFCNCDRVSNVNTSSLHLGCLFRTVEHLFCRHCRCDANKFFFARVGFYNGSCHLERFSRRIGGERACMPTIARDLLASIPFQEMERGCDTTRVTALANLCVANNPNLFAIIPEVAHNEECRTFLVSVYDGKVNIWQLIAMNLMNHPLNQLVAYDGGFVCHFSRARYRAKLEDELPLVIIVCNLLTRKMKIIGGVIYPCLFVLESLFCHASPKQMLRINSGRFHENPEENPSRRG